VSPTVGSATGSAPPTEPSKLRQLTSAEVRSKAMRLIQLAQHAEDLSRATEFYTRLLDDGPVATYDPPGLVFFRLGDTRLLLENGAPTALIYLAVPDVRAKVEELRSDGVVIESEPHVIFRHRDAVLGRAGTQECQAFIRDSEGNLVGLVTLYPDATAD
jgi:methylmalonyl-CoA/ethylmalonyl-CoA epimerase